MNPSTSSTKSKKAPRKSQAAIPSRTKIRLNRNSVPRSSISANAPKMTILTKKTDLSQLGDEAIETLIQTPRLTFQGLINQAVETAQLGMRVGMLTLRRSFL